MYSNRPTQNDEPLWSAFQSETGRSSTSFQEAETSIFFLCGIYSVIAIFFLIAFGLRAYFLENTALACILFGFSFITFMGYLGIWLSGHLFLAKHLVVSLYGLLCLYLFYSGGTENTGPVFYLLFPCLALFLQTSQQGLFSSLTLFFITIILYNTEAFGFNAEQYNFIFISRLLTVYFILTILSCLFARSKQATENELLLSNADLSEHSPADHLTHLASRNFMEKLLSSESKRYSRYRSTFSIIMIRIDDFRKIQNSYGHECSDFILCNTANLIQSVFRSQDFPSRWEDDVFLILLPESSKENAQFVAERFLEKIRNHIFIFKKNKIQVTASIGIFQAQKAEIDETIEKASRNLSQATEASGNCIVNT